MCSAEVNICLTSLLPQEYLQPMRCAGPPLTGLLLPAPFGRRIAPDTWVRICLTSLLPQVYLQPLDPADPSPCFDIPRVTCRAPACPGQQAPQSVGGARAHPPFTPDALLLVSRGPCPVWFSSWIVQSGGLFMPLGLKLGGFLPINTARPGARACDTDE